MKTQKIILITGLPRSGSTWVSQTIAHTSQCYLVHEPFNWLLHPERMRFHMKYIPSGQQDKELIKILKKHIFLAPYETIRHFPQRLSNPLSLLSTRCVLIKDVHICLSVEYVWEELHPEILILIRHPCAMAQSWYKMGLKVEFRIETLLQQEQMLNDHLAPFKQHLIQSKDDFFRGFGAYWGASYFVLKRISQQHPDWLWVTHEETCANAFKQYSTIIKQLGIHFSLSNKQALMKFLNMFDRPQKEHEGSHSIARVTISELSKWKSLLTPEQINAIIAGAEPFGIMETFFYK